MYGKAYAGIGLGAGSVSIPGAVYDAVADFWDREIPTELTKAQIRNLLEMIIPAYHTAILEKNLPPYEYSPLGSSNAQLFDYLIAATGQPRDILNDALFSLESCTMNGTIDGRYLRPDTWQEVAPPTAWEQFTEAVAPGASNLGEQLNKQFNKVLIGGAILVAVVMIGKTVVRSAFAR